MAREIPGYVSQLQMGSMPQVQFTDAMANVVTGVAGIAGDIGAKIQEERDQTENLRYEIAIDKGLSEIKNTAGNDIALLQQKIDGFSKGLLKDAPGRLQEKLQLRIQTSSNPLYESAYKVQRDIAKDENKLLHLERVRLSQDTIKNNVSLLRDEDPNTRASAGRAVQQSIADIKSSLRATGPDGNIFTPEQINEGETEIKDYVVSKDVEKWFKEQPNKLAAVEKWRNGEVNLTLPNVEGATALDQVSSDTIFDSLLKQESGGKQFASNGSVMTSEAGATGIAQIMPETGPDAAKLAGVAWDEQKFKTDANYNKKLGRAYFDKQVSDFGSPAIALMAYNAGPGAVRDFMDGTNKAGKNPNKLTLGDPTKGEVTTEQFIQNFPFKETRDYVNAIASNSGLAVVNSRQSLSSDAVEKLDKDIVSQYKEDLQLEESVRVKQERQDKEIAEFQYTEHQKRLQDKETPLTLEELDLYRGIYNSGGRSKEYLAMRAEIVRGEPEVEDGATRNHLLDMSARGQDINESGLQAVKDGRIKMSTFNQINDLRQATQGPAADTLAFNLKQLDTSLAKLNASGVVENGAVLANAKAALVNEHNKFIEKNARPPSFKEADEIRRAIQANSSMVGSDFTLISDKPDYIPASIIMDDKVPYKDMAGMVFKKYDDKYKEQSAAASQVLGGMGEQGIKKYLMQQDPEFIRDSLWLQKVKSFRSPTPTTESPK